MIPGTIDEWKAALASSKPGLSRLACVAALMEIGQTLEGKHGDKWVPLTLIGDFRGHDEYRVKPAPRPGNAEDAKRHVGCALRVTGERRVFIIRDVHSAKEYDWTGREYATPIPGTDPSTWNWQKCEVVE